MNDANSAGITPFLAASSSGDRSLCEMLLARGANLTAKSLNLTTALHFAVLSGNVEICELIITAGEESLRELLNSVEPLHNSYLDDRGKYPLKRGGRYGELAGVI